MLVFLCAGGLKCDRNLGLVVVTTVKKFKHSKELYMTWISSLHVQNAIQFIRKSKSVLRLASYTSLWCCSRFFLWISIAPLPSHSLKTHFGILRFLCFKLARVSSSAQTEITYAVSSSPQVLQQFISNSVTVLFFFYCWRGEITWIYFL